MFVGFERAGMEFAETVETEEAPSCWCEEDRLGSMARGGSQNSAQGHVVRMQ